jgi:spore coat protein A
MSQVTRRTPQAGPDTGPAADPGPLGLEPYLDRLPVPPIRRPAANRLTLTARGASAYLHRHLPPTPVWAYDGRFPGPTIEVRRGQRLVVRWLNGIRGPYPVPAVRLPGGDASALDRPGAEGGVPVPGAADLPAWTVVHLHGAVTTGASDGWPEDAVPFGASQLAEYLNDQPGAALWYRDASLGVARLNVMAGLLGLYVVRDEEEEALDLPRGGQELPLVICDRNLATTPDGRLTGQLLCKTVAGRPFTGPYTLVNGKIWPYREVNPSRYRFRVLNASHARTYRLAATDAAGRPLTGLLQQIGTDGGLLAGPVALDGPLVLAPGERADVVADLGARAGERVRLVDASDDVVEPAVLELRVTRRPPASPGRRVARPLSAAFSPARRSDTAGLRTRLVLLVGTELWEMAEDAAAPVPAAGVVQVADGVTTRTWRRVARAFADAPTVDVDEGDAEVWHLLHAGGPDRPVESVHVHLAHLQVLARRPVDVTGFDPGLGGTVRPLAVAPPAPPAPGGTGRKDTVAVAPGELVEVLARFTGGAGRFSYHSQLLDHADAGMVRPLVVRPAAVRAARPDEPPGRG